MAAMLFYKRKENNKPRLLNATIIVVKVTMHYYSEVIRELNSSDNSVRHI